MRGARSMPLHPPRELDGALEALGVRPGCISPASLMVHQSLGAATEVTRPEIGWGLHR
jgi:hypothetical protein